MEPSSISTGIRANRTYIAMLKAIAGKRDTSVSQLVREACDHYLKADIAELTPFFADGVARKQQSSNGRKRSKAR